MKTSLLIGALVLGIGLGIFGTAVSQTGLWATAQPTIGLGLVVSSCAAQNWTAGTYAQVTIKATGELCTSQ